MTARADDVSDCASTIPTATVVTATRPNAASANALRRFSRVVVL
jgi:hypothetical protein